MLSTQNGMPLLHGLTKVLTTYARGTSGTLAVWGAVALPATLAAAAFAVDSSRLYSMDAELQSAVDAMAKAGAAELDGRADSESRARAAIKLLLQNPQSHGLNPGQARVTDNGIRFLSALPSDPSVTAPASMEAQSAAEARYVEVTLETETVRTILPHSVVTSVIDTDMSATSTAGRAERVCGVAPVFICNPFEDSGQSFQDIMRTTDFQRRQIQFKRPTGQTASHRGGRRGRGRNCGGDESTWGPGSFGWLEIPGTSGASAMREAVGIDIPDTCLSTGGTVRLRNGNVNSMHHGFNVRFDIYSGSMQQKQSDPRFAPAENVTKGYSGSACSMSPDDKAMGFPRDKCHERGDCADGHGQLGDGEWDFIEYMRVNHAKMSPITIDGITYSINYNSNQMSPSTPPSRYAMYRWEIDYNCIPGPKTYGSNASTPEEGTPQCHTSGASTAGVDRRVFRAAVLNCETIEATGGMTSGRDLPVETFVDVFITEPMGSGSTPTLYGEIIGPSVAGIGDLVAERAELTR